MTVVPTRTFCCCLPTRFGVVLIALIGLVGGGFISIGAGIKAHLINGSKVSIGLTIAIYALLALVSLLGFIGAVGRKLALVKLYFLFLVCHLLFSLAIGIYAIWRIFKDGNGFMKDCVNAHPQINAGDAKQLCSSGLKAIKGVTVTLAIIFWLIEIWGCVIVSSYAGQLADEQAVEGVVKDTEAW